MNDTVTTIISAQALRSTEIPPLHSTVSRVAGDFWFSISIEPKAFTIHIGTYPPFEMTQGLQLSVCTGQRILDTKSQKLDVKKINK